jgi:predicted porin
VGSSSAGRHYELSSSHHARVIAQSRAKNTTYSVGATTKANDSEDALVKEEASRSSEFSSIAPDKQSIAVTTEYRVHEEQRPTGQVRLDV